MNWPITLSEIIKNLHDLGYSANIHNIGGKLYFNGKELVEPIKWIHAHWFDDFTDERITIYCCIAGTIKGTFIHGKGE